MKILYLQDSHIKGINPTNRLGDYYSDVMAKIKEIIKLSKKLKVDKVLFGGDLYDTEIASNTLIDDFVDLVEDSNIVWECIFGNHDEISHNPKLSKRTSLAHIFRRSKLINHLDMIDIENKIQIVGFDYYHGIEEDIKNNNLLYQEDLNPKALKIAVIHAFITLKPFLPNVLHVTVKDIKTNFDALLCAHNHKGWGIKEINDTKFINIGCIGRTGIDEMKVIPQVLFIDTNKKEFKTIPLKSVKPNEEIFNIQKIEESKQYEKDIENFVKSIESTKFQGLNIRGKLEEIAKEKKVDKEIIDDIAKRIGGFENEEKVG